MTEKRIANRAKVKKRSQLKSIWFRFKKNKLAMVGLTMLVVMIFIAVFADLFASYEGDAITQNMKERLQPFSRDHIFGTDQYGRDMFARIIFGARISLFVGIVTIVISLSIGAIIGATAGYFGGKIDNTIMRIMDVFLAIPQMLMAISIVASLGPGMVNLMIALIISLLPRFSRIVRSSILSIKDQEFIEACRACGSSSWRIISKHILPNAIGPIIVQATLDMAATIIAISGLSFIGLGISPPTPEWGAMLSEGREQMRHYPHLVVIPGIAIMLAVMALNLMGDGLRDALDPRMKN